MVCCSLAYTHPGPSQIKIYMYIYILYLQIKAVLRVSVSKKLYSESDSSRRLAARFWSSKMAAPNPSKAQIMSNHVNSHAQFPFIKTQKGT